MEQPFKRQRISRISRRSNTENPRSGNSGSMSSADFGSANINENQKTVEEQPIRSSYKPSATADSKHGPRWSGGGGSALWPRHQRFHQRQEVPRHKAAPTEAVKTVLQSVVQIIVESGHSSVGAFTLPTVPTVVSFPSYGPLTVPAVPAYPSVPSQTLPTVPAYPFTTTAASSSSIAAVSAPATVPEILSVLQPSNSSGITISPSQPSQPSRSSSTSNSPSSQSSTESSSALTLSTSPSLTTGGNFSTTTFTVSDRTTTFIGTSTIDLDAINNSTASTSATISGTSSTRTTSSDITSQSSHNTISTSSSDSSSRTVTESSSIGSSSTGTATGAAGLGGATGSPGGSTPTGGVSDGGSDTGNSTAPPTPTVVGSVVGGVAGLALIAILLLLLLRWHRRRKRPIRPAAGDDSEIVPPGTAQSGAMTQRSSNVPLAGAAIAPGFFKRLRPQSVQTTATTETAPSERGFQNLGGRKLPSVFTAGRDGYGGGYDKDTMSGSSFYRDSQGFYGGPGSPTAPAFAGPSSGPSGHGLSPVTDVRDKEVAVMRPSPARTPVTSAGGFEGLPSPPRAPSTPRGTPPPAIGTYPRDAIGRSRPSFNGSRGSKFTEEPI